MIRPILRFAALLLLVASCTAQVVKLDGGGSTLGTSGGGVTAAMYFPGNNTMTLSGGVLNGKPTGGLGDSFLYHGGEVNVGTQTMSQGIDGTGVMMNGIGLGFTKSENHDDAAGFFVGSVGTGFFLPYVTGVVPQHVGAVLFVKHRFNHVRFGTILATSGGERTALGSVAWKSHDLDAVAVGGILNTQRFSSASITYRPSETFSVNFNHYDTFTPLPAISDSLGGGFNLLHLTLSSFVTRSTSIEDPRPALAENGMVIVRAGIITNMLGVYNSRSGFIPTDTVTEKLSRHLQTSQMFSESHGTKNVSFGGDYVSNRVSCGLDYGMGYIPLTGTFQKTTSIHVSFSIRGTKMSSQIITAVGIKPEYQVTSEKFIRGSLEPAVKTNAASKGKYVIFGIVSDGKDPISGVAVQVGKDLLYTNRNGQFSAHSKTTKPVEVSVDLSQSLTQVDWAVKDCPKITVPSVEGTTVTILLMRP